MSLSEARKLENYLKRRKGGGGFFSYTGLSRISLHRWRTSNPTSAICADGRCSKARSRGDQETACHGISGFAHGPDGDNPLQQRRIVELRETLGSNWSSGNRYCACAGSRGTKRRSECCNVTIITDIMDLSKIAARKLRLELAPFQLYPAVDETLACSLQMLTRCHSNGSPGCRR
jgi:hypothetical protein